MGVKRTLGLVLGISGGAALCLAVLRRLKSRPDAGGDQLPVVEQVCDRINLMGGLGAHDLRAANTFVRSSFPTGSPISRWGRFGLWATRQILFTVPDALKTVSFARPVSRVPIWLAEDNPLANYPWFQRKNARLPKNAEVVVIGAGFTGAGCAYHWARQAQSKSKMVVLEMADPASGASGANAGLVVMGRYFALVKRTMRRYLDLVRADLPPVQRDQLAAQFAGVYARSAYRNADLIQETITREGFDCSYERRGWIQAVDQQDQAALEESVRIGKEAGFSDWSNLSPRQARELGGIRVDCPTGFSAGAACFHPARWVWSLLGTAIQQSNVELFTRSQARKVEDAGDVYRVITDRGVISARYVINATESFTGIVLPRYRELIAPVQTQSAFALGGPITMKPHVMLSNKRGFFGRLAHVDGVIFGSDETHLPYDLAGHNQPSRFITKFLIGEMLRYVGRSSMHVTHEWSSTAGFTADEFPVVGILDGKRHYVIGGMCGSGTGVSFNAARQVVQDVLGVDGPSDYPPEYFAPSRLLDPKGHAWPSLEEE